MNPIIFILTVKLCGGRQLWQPHQDLSTVRFIDLLASGCVLLQPFYKYFTL